MASTFGCLQVVLDKFQEDDGFSSNFIVAFFIVFVCSAIALVLWELVHPQPVFDVKLFKFGSFGAANIVMLLVGFSLFSTTQLIPQFAQNLLQYDALAAGQTLALGGLAAAIMMPFAGIAASKLAPKLLVGFGLLCTGLAMMHTAFLNGQISFFDLSMTRVYQSLSLPLLFVSLTTAGYVGIPPERNNEASAIINLSRNLGGSIGVATASTMLAWRIQFHHERLGEQGVDDRRARPPAHAERDGRRAAGRERPGPGAQLPRHLLRVRDHGVARHARRVVPQDARAGRGPWTLNTLARPYA